MNHEISRDLIFTFTVHFNSSLSFNLCHMVSIFDKSPDAAVEQPVTQIARSRRDAADMSNLLFFSVSSGVYRNGIRLGAEILRGTDSATVSPAAERRRV